MGDRARVWFATSRALATHTHLRREGERAAAPFCPLPYLLNAHIRSLSVCAYR